MIMLKMMCFAALGALLSVGGIKVSEQPGLFFSILGSAVLIGIFAFVEGMLTEREWRK